MLKILIFASKLSPSKMGDYTRFEASFAGQLGNKPHLPNFNLDHNRHNLVNLRVHGGSV